MSSNQVMINNNTYSIPEPGDFSNSDDYMNTYLKDAYDAISSTDGGWDFMKNKSPPEDKGYMFWENEMLTKIHNNMKEYGGHSGGSYGMTMRHMEYIAKNGWEDYFWKFIGPKRGDFSWVKNDFDRKILEYAFNTYESIDGAWDYLDKSYNNLLSPYDNHESIEKEIDKADYKMLLAAAPLIRIIVLEGWIKFAYQMVNKWGHLPADKSIRIEMYGGYNS